MSHRATLPAYLASGRKPPGFDRLPRPRRAHARRPLVPDRLGTVALGSKARAAAGVGTYSLLASFGRLGLLVDDAVGVAQLAVANGVVVWTRTVLDLALDALAAACLDLEGCLAHLVVALPPVDETLRLGIDRLSFDLAGRKQADVPFLVHEPRVRFRHGRLRLLLLLTEGSHWASFLAVTTYRWLV